eukprot:9726816-Alexandrium_andersonii.AAC.1
MGLWSWPRGGRGLTRAPNRLCPDQGGLGGPAQDAWPPYALRPGRGAVQTSPWSGPGPTAVTGCSASAPDR